jgi:hypothetical protein
MAWLRAEAITTAISPDSEVRTLRRTFLVSLAVLAVACPAALAAPAKHKPPTTGPGCKPQVSVIVKGTVAVAPGAAATLPFSLQVNVTHANLFGQAYVKAAQPVSVNVSDQTKLKLGKQKGLAALQALQVNDRVRIQARACKADLANGATPPLTAKRIDAHHPKS